MISLEHYLQSLPRPFIAQLHKRAVTTEGLVTHDRLRNEVREWYLDSERLSNTISQLDPRGIALLKRLHLSPMGLSTDQAAKTLHANDRSAILALFDMLIWEGLAIRVKRPESRILPIQEQASFLWPLWNSQESTPRFNAFENAPFLSLHYYRTAAYILLGKIRCTQSGELHKRDASVLSQSFSSFEIWGPDAAQEELDFCLRRLQRGTWISEFDGKKILRQGFENDLPNPSTLWKQWLDYWMSDRKWSAESLKSFLHSLDHPKQCAQILNLWNPGILGDYRCSWEDIPPILKEMWFLGLIQFEVHSGICNHIQTSSLGITYCEGSTSPWLSPARFVTPNFEIHQPLWHMDASLFALECIAGPGSGDQVLRYTLKSDGTLLALESGLSPQNLRAIAQWPETPTNITEAIQRWIHSFEVGTIQSCILIRIQDNDLLNKLKSQPTLMELGAVFAETGLVVLPGQLALFREMLKSFGVHLPPESNTRQIAAIPSNTGKGDHTPFEFDTQLHPPKLELLESQPQKVRLGHTKKAQDFAQKLRLLECAILTEDAVELRENEQSDLQLFQPKMILRQQAPIRVAGVFVGESSLEVQFEVSQLHQVRMP